VPASGVNWFIGRSTANKVSTHQKKYARPMLSKNRPDYVEKGWVAELWFRVRVTGNMLQDRHSSAKRDSQESMVETSETN